MVVGRPGRPLTFVNDKARLPIQLQCFRREFAVATDAHAGSLFLDAKGMASYVVPGPSRRELQVATREWLTRLDLRKRKSVTPLRAKRARVTEIEKLADKFRGTWPA